MPRGRCVLNRKEGRAKECWDLDGSSQRLPISVLTRFLGSGKRTVLSDTLRVFTGARDQPLERLSGPSGNSDIAVSEVRT